MTLKTIIVEDEKHSRETLKNLLEKFCEDVEVIAMTSGVKEAIELLSVTTPDVVFLDIELQKGTGFDILRRCLRLILKLFSLQLLTNMPLKP